MGAVLRVVCGASVSMCLCEASNHKRLLISCLGDIS